MKRGKNAIFVKVEHFFHSCKNQSEKKGLSWNCAFASRFHKCHCDRIEGDGMENKVRKEMESPLIQLKMIRDNVNHWDVLWASY